MATLVFYLIHNAISTADLALNPIVAASGLAIHALGKESITLPLLNSSVDLPRLRTYVTKRSLRILLVLGIIRVINRNLNSWATSNWRIRNTTQWRWHSEVAVVTGGCSGIGRSIVHALAQRGIKVAILDVSPLPEDMSIDGNVSYFRCDITSADSVAEAAKQIRATVGEPSVLVNNAGVVNAGRTILSSSDEAVHHLMAVNLLSLWTTTREFLPHMVQENKGHVITTASMASFISLPGAADYAVAKAGALAFHENLCFEIRNAYKAPGVLATVVHPSWVRTGMTEEFIERIESAGGKVMAPEEITSRVMEHVLQARGGQIIAPPNVAWLTGVRGWPNWLQEVLRDGGARAFEDSDGK